MISCRFLFWRSYSNNNNFVRRDFDLRTGAFSIRGSIVDIYSFAEERPVRIDFFGDDVDSIRFFDVESQLSEQVIDEVAIVPDLSDAADRVEFTDLFQLFS